LRSCTPDPVPAGRRRVPEPRDPGAPGRGRPAAGSVAAARPDAGRHPGRPRAGRGRGHRRRREPRDIRPFTKLDGRHTFIGYKTTSVGRPHGTSYDEVRHGNVAAVPSRAAGPPERIHFA